MELTEADIQPQMTRRRPGQSALTTPRDEKDRVEIQSGTEFGITLGTPIGMVVRNEDQRPKDYGNSTMDLYPRPSHADWTYLEKYGVKASSGGGRSSARETIGRVAAGAVAEKYLRLAHGIEITAFVSSVGNIHMYPPTPEYPTASTNPSFLSLIQTITRERVDEFVPVRCPDPKVSDAMANLIAEFRDQKDSIGGTVTCVIRNVPSGLGEPAFSKMEAMLAHAMLSIPACKAFEVGSGFSGCEVPGSIHNDPFILATDVPPMESGAWKNGIPRPKLTTKTNNSGGIQGGITNGAPIYFRVAFKPPATIGQAQQTATYDGTEDGILEAKGRHDPCVVPRAVPIVEAMAALVVIDALMAQQARQTARSLLPPLKQTIPAKKTTVGGADAVGKKEMNDRGFNGNAEFVNPLWQPHRYMGVPEKDSGSPSMDATLDYIRFPRMLDMVWRYTTTSLWSGPILFEKSLYYQLRRIPRQRGRGDLFLGMRRFTHLNGRICILNVLFSAFLAGLGVPDDAVTHFAKRSRSSCNNPGFYSNISVLEPQDGPYDSAQSPQLGPAMACLKELDLRNDPLPRHRRQQDATIHVRRKRLRTPAPIGLANAASPVPVALKSIDFEEP
ncbi:hypothetical protein B7494_g5757 [Chlorociboria aeruginascens]|nr:hypothetical protein B7494_g5757 [Chlorociboria aeruginascens]